MRYEVVQLFVYKALIGKRTLPSGERAGVRG